MPNIPQDFPFRMVAGTSLEARLDARCWGLYVSNYTAQWVEIADANEFVPPNTRQVISLPGVLVAKATFAAPPGVIQPVAVAAQAAILTYTEREVQPSGGVVGATTLPAVTQIERFTQALLPAAGTAGRLVLLTNYDRSVWKDTGTRFVSLEGETFNVKQFGAVGDGVVDDSVAIDAAITAAAATVPGGADVVFPPGRYKRTTPIAAAAGVRLVGMGASNRWGRNPTSVQLPVRIEYNGPTAALNVVAAAGANLRNFKVMNIAFDGTNSIGAVDGCSFDVSAAAASIQGIVFEDCMFSNFPRSQMRQPATGAGSSMWGLTFTRCSMHDADRTTTGNLVDFVGLTTALAEVTFDDCILAPYLAGEWAAKLVASTVRFIGGTVAPFQAGAHGLWLSGGSSVIGTHLEGLGGGTTSIGARLLGAIGHFFAPGLCSAFNEGVQVGDPTAKATATAGVHVLGSVGNNTVRDVHIIDGGSRRFTVVGPVGDASGTGLLYLDDRRVIDGIQEVIRMDAGNVQLPDGSAAAPTLRWTSLVNGLYVDTASGDIRFATQSADSMRLTIGRRLSTARQLYGGSGVTDGAFQTVAGILGGTGVPTNAVGNDGDIYIRSDGGAGTTIYQRRAAVWVATGA